MARAVLNGQTIAESDDIVVVEGNQYFPLDSLDKSIVAETDLHTKCFWKGEASYYTLTVGDVVAENAAWYYPEPLAGAEEVANRVAFYPVVTIEA